MKTIVALLTTPPFIGLFERLGVWWCKNMHSEKMLSRPVNGTYRCMVCFRRYEAPWR